MNCWARHVAILGTTGTGKSCTTALILRAILEQNPAAHIVLLDPHNEYATAFAEWAEVISPRNMQLPFWLLNFEELIEVLISDPSRKAEIEILQELIPIAKARYSAGRARDDQVVRRSIIPRAGPLHRRHPGAVSHIRPDRPHRRAHGQAGEQARSLTLSQPSRPASTPSRRTAATPSCSARSPSMMA